MRKHSFILTLLLFFCTMSFGQIVKTKVIDNGGSGQYSATAGHGGTFAEEYGGSFARMALDWLNWQFKGEDNSAIFLEKDLSEYPGWTMEAKNF